MMLELRTLCVALSAASVGFAMQQELPAPESVLGFEVGADFHLATYEQSLAYFRALDAASDRVELVPVGRSSFNRPWYMALISSPQNLQNLDRLRQGSLQLAHPAGLDDAEARELAREGVAFVNIDGGLHASEVAPAQHTIQLGYQLASSTDPEILGILENVVLMLWPSVNPDGQTMVADWYASNLGTPYETSGMPMLYQKYIGHDNNRDAYMLNMVESRVVERTWRHWEPQIRYVPHQSSPFPTRIWLPPFAEPVSGRVHPLMSRTVNSIGMLIAMALEERGQVGATHMEGFDAWYPGYVDYMPMLQNSAAFWTETAGYRYATPRYYPPSDIPAGRRDLRAESLYSSPWPGGWWRIKDAVDYITTSSLAVLEFASKYKDDLLYNRYQAGRDTIAKYAAEPPYAYFVPQEQRDPVAAVELLRRLAFNGIEVHRLTTEVLFEGQTYPGGTWVIAMNQEYAELVRQVLEAQEYPDLRQFPGGPPARPYDVAGWTLPFQFGVRVVEARSPLGDVGLVMQPVTGAARDWREPFAAATDPASAALDAAAFDSVPGLGFDTDPVAAGIVPPPGRITGTGAAVALDPAHNNTFRAINRAWREGGTVEFEEGRYLIRGISEQRVAELVDGLHLRAERTDDEGEAIAQPRLGLFRPWSPSMDEGWTRWLLEVYGFQFDSLRAADFRAGPLQDRWDVILLADYGARAIVEGSAVGTVPGQYAGGIGPEGVQALQDFVEAGGTLVCMNGSCAFAIEALGLQVENAVAGIAADEFSISGSLLQVEVDTAHPLMAGMPEHADVFFGRSPVFRTTEGFEGFALAKYQKAGSPLRSGFLLGEDSLHDHAAALDVLKGNGNVVLLGFRPQWRGQPFGTFRILFNAALYHGDHASNAFGTDGFWTSPEAKDSGTDGR